MRTPRRLRPSLGSSLLVALRVLVLVPALEAALMHVGVGVDHLVVAVLVRVLGVLMVVLGVLVRVLDPVVGVVEMSVDTRGPRIVAGLASLFDSPGHP